MARKPLTIPPDAARAFMRDLRAYHATRNGDKRTQIAARSAEELSKHLPGKEVVSMEEITELFRRMKGAAINAGAGRSRKKG